MIDEKRLIELLEDEILRVDTESTPGCGNLYGRDASVMKNALNFVIDLINEQPKVGEWIPCNERLPEERESSFAKLKGTDKWIEGMFEKKSDDVNVTIEFSDGKRKVITTKIIDGQWNKHTILKPIKFIAWQPLPKPYKGD